MSQVCHQAISIAWLDIAWTHPGSSSILAQVVQSQWATEVLLTPARPQISVTFSSIWQLKHPVWMDACSKHGSFSECPFSTNPIAKLQVMSVVAELGLTSLAFIRSTRLSLCWYKSTEVPTGAGLIYTRAGSSFTYSFLFCSVFLARTQQRSFLCSCFT